MDKAYQSFNKHFPKAISKDIRDYVTNVVLKESRYIFIRRVKGIQFGYCTHCNNRFMTPTPLKHNDFTDCPKCGSRCEVKNHGTSRKYMIDSGFVVYYEKSKVNPNAIIARAWRVSRDYTKEYTEVKTHYQHLAKYLFEPGNAEMYERYFWNDTWHKCNSVYSLESKSLHANNWCSEESIRKAIQGTPFQYSTWDKHDQPQGDYVKFFALYSKYPVIEYLTKLGFGYFVQAKLFDRKTFSCINWRGKRVDQILRLSMQEIKEVQKCGDCANPLHLRLFQKSRSDNNRPSFKEIVSFFNRSEDVASYLDYILNYAKLSQVMAYIKKQLQHSKNREYRDYPAILIAWRDYLQECIELGYDLSNDFYLFPKDLYEAHQRTMKLVQMKADEILDQKIRKRVKELEGFCFEHEGLLIRPARSAQELIQEGKKLEHCVGRYTEDYAEGKTSIFLIRRLNAPNKPFYTMEIRDNRIIQTRGFKNASATDTVKTFIDEFTKAKLGKKSKRKGVAV